MLHKHSCFIVTATVIEATSTDLMRMLVNDKSFRWKEFRVSIGINEDINAMPISNQDFNIAGIDITLLIVLDPLLVHPLHIKLQQSLRIIKHMLLTRGLRYFVIIYGIKPTPSMDMSILSRIR